MKIAIALLALLTAFGVASPIMGIEGQCLVEGQTCYHTGCCGGLVCKVGFYTYNYLRMLTWFTCSTLPGVKATPNVENNKCLFPMSRPETCFKNKVVEESRAL